MRLWVGFRDVRVVNRVTREEKSLGARRTRFRLPMPPHPTVAGHCNLVQLQCPQISRAGGNMFKTLLHVRNTCCMQVGKGAQLAYMVLDQGRPQPVVSWSIALRFPELWREGNYFLQLTKPECFD